MTDQPSLWVNNTCLKKQTTACDQTAGGRAIISACAQCLRPYTIVKATKRPEHNGKRHIGMSAVLDLSPHGPNESQPEL